LATFSGIERLRFGKWFRSNSIRDPQPALSHHAILRVKAMGGIQFETFSDLFQVGDCGCYVQIIIRRQLFRTG
jgi:hypothetical protein